MEIGDEVDIFWHRQTHGTGFCRQGCADRVHIRPDGTIPQIEITSCGLNRGSLPAKGAYQTYIACHLTEKDRTKVGHVVEPGPGESLPEPPEHMPYITEEENDGFEKGLKPYIGYRTVVPIPLAEACAWEPELWEKTARLAAKEATAGGVHMTFAPMVDVAKDARWGRVSEGAGENPVLASAFGVAKVKGFQGDDLSRPDAMAACVKHFAAYGAAEAGRDYNRVDLSLQRLYEECLPPFEACVKAGARAIMPAFNDISGVPCTVNGWLLNDVLRRDWGFEGVTVSDSNAIAECVNHGFSANRAEAAKQAIEAGVDID